MMTLSYYCVLLTWFTSYTLASPSSRNGDFSRISLTFPAEIHYSDYHLLTVEVSFDCDQLLDLNATLINVKIQIPFETINAGDCAELVTGDNSCISSAVTNFIELFTFKNNEASIDVGSNFVISNEEATIDTNLVGLTDSDLQRYLNVNFDIDIVSCTGSSYGTESTFTIDTEVAANSGVLGTNFNITAAVDVDGGSNDAIETASVDVIGALLNLQVTETPSSDVIGGGSIRYDINAYHDSLSTEDVLDPQVTLDFRSVQTNGFIGTSYYSYGSTGNDTDITMSTHKEIILDRNLTLSETFSLVTEQSLPDTLSLGDNVLLTLTVEGNEPDGRFVSFTDYGIVPPRKLVYGDVSGHDINQFVPAQTYSISVSFQMAKGRVNNLAVFSDFTSSDMSTIPIIFDKADLMVPASLQFVGNKNLTSFTQSRKRRSVDEANARRFRRSVSASQYTSGVFGTITNSNSGLSATMTVTLVFHIDGNTPAGSLSGSIGLAYGTTTDNIIYSTLPVDTININLQKSVVNASSDPSIIPTKVRFTSLVEVDPATSTIAKALDVVLTDGNMAFDVLFGEDFTGPGLGAPGFEIVNDRLMTWTKSELSAAGNESMELSYVATPNDQLAEGENWLSSVLTYRLAAGGPQVTLTDQVCVYKSIKLNESIIYQYGFTALAVLIGLIVGALIVLLIIFIVYKVRRRTPFESSAIRPVSAVDNHAVSRKHATGGLILDGKGAWRKGINALMNLSSSLYDASIVGMLSMTDKLKALRHLDNMDIGATSRVDQDLENERNQAMIDATKLLLGGMHKNGDIPPSVKDKALSNFQKKMDKMDKDQSDEFKKEMEAMLKNLSQKNKEKLGNLMEKHEEEKEALEDKIKHMGQKEKDELRSLLKKQQDTEMEELKHLMELEQKEELEKMRKEGVIRRRMGIKGLQQEVLDEVKTQSNLTPEQADWLMKEHFKNQAAIEKMYDDEISRQRMILEEKLARRKALAENKNLQEDADTELLNQIAEQQIGLVAKAKKTKVLSASEAQAMVDDVQKQLLATKEKLDAERNKQESALNKKLSERKRHRMEELAKKQKQELQELDKKHIQMQAGKGYVDPVELMQSRQVMMSHHRSEMGDLENEIDKEDAIEFGQLREESNALTKTEIEAKKDDLVTNLKSQGMSDDKLDQLLQKHKQEQEDLLAQQEEDKKRQMKKFKKQLSTRKAQWEHRRLEEQVEQENLREHEENVVRKLVDNQVALSESERERILQEHEKQMVTIENSLTLNKLQQQRMLEEKLAKKRAQQLDKLQKKHSKEIKKQSRDDEVNQEDELDLLRKQAEDRIGVIRGETLQLDDEMDEIRGAMMKERANALKEQEIKLGAMLAQLQMDKAKEMSRIEEQQKAIHNLKTSLMDDLNEKGKLSDPECQKVIEIHQKEQEKLNKKLDSQREKQEKRFKRHLRHRLDARERLILMEHAREEEEFDQALRQRLESRLKQKEKNLSRIQQQEMEESQGMAGLGAAAKLRRAAFATKHMLEVEKFRNHMENEISQTLQEMKRQNEIRRIEALQGQEIQFINGLVRLGKFKGEELHEVVGLLFPHKSETERKAILDKLLDGTNQVDDKKKGKGKHVEDEEEADLNSTLTQRVLANTLAKVELQTTSGPLKGYQYLFKSLPAFNGINSKGKPEHVPRKSSHRRSSAWSSKQRKSIESGRSVISDPETNAAIKKLKKKRSGFPMAGGLDSRPDPIGRMSPEGYDDHYSGARYSQIPPSKLPPLERATKKKAKRKGISAEADF